MSHSPYAFTQGVTSLTGAATIKVNAASGAITLTDVGVTSIAGTANQITASASTGAVTLSLPQSIATTSAVTFNTLTATASLIGLGNTSLGTGVASSSLYNGVPLLVRAGAGVGAGVNAWFSQYGARLYVASVDDTGAYIPFVFRASTYAFQNSANGGNGQLGVHILDVANNFASFNTTTQYSGATLNVNGGGYINGVTTSTSLVATSSLGYGTGAGGTVTQTVSASSTVAINKLSGQITLISASRGSGYATFSVTNTLVAFTDVIHICQQYTGIGNTLYIPAIQSVGNGWFSVSVWAQNSTPNEAPVFNFAVIKAVNA